MENFDLSLVAECLRERHYLLQNAPNLVKLRPVYIPVYTHSKRSPWMIRLGLSLYALLGELKKEARFSKIKDLNHPDLAELNKTDLQAVFRYYEAQTDDSALTVAVMRSAQDMNAELCLNSTVQKIELTQNGSEIFFQQKTKDYKFNAKVVINAAGPWATNILKNIHPTQEKVNVDLVQGTHIILPLDMGEKIYYIESPIDGRPVFVMPWYGDTMIGTTELLFERDPAETKPTNEEIEYLLATFYEYFPAIKDRDLQVAETFAGLRVLPKSSEKANKRSRETIFICDREDKPRVISIFGGKLTAYRATAEIVVNKIKRSLPLRTPIADTKKLNLFG